MQEHFWELLVVCFQRGGSIGSATSRIFILPSKSDVARAIFVCCLCVAQEMIRVRYALGTLRDVLRGTACSWTFVEFIYHKALLSIIEFTIIKISD